MYWYTALISLTFFTEEMYYFQIMSLVHWAWLTSVYYLRLQLSLYKKCLRKCMKYHEFVNSSFSFWNFTEETTEKYFFISAKVFTCMKHRFIPVRFLHVSLHFVHMAQVTWASLSENCHLSDTNMSSLPLLTVQQLCMKIIRSWDEQDLTLKLTVF